MHTLLSKATGKLLIAGGAIGFPLGFCLMFAGPVGMVVAAVLSEGSGSRDEVQLGAGIFMYIASLVSTVCVVISPLIAIVGLVIYILADQQGKKRAPGPHR